MLKNNLIYSIVEYAVNNLNRAAETLEKQKDYFDNDDEFYKEILDNSSIELDDFVVGMATSESYIDETIEALVNKGYKIDEPAAASPQNLVRDLVSIVGKKNAVMLIMDL